MARAITGTWNNAGVRGTMSMVDLKIRPAWPGMEGWMEILFLGVGEACDPAYLNTSLLVRPEGAKACTAMLDCGFTVPHRYFLGCGDAEQLEALWISHFHGDHFFGVPLLLLRFWEMGRRQPLRVLGPAGVADRVTAAMNLAYPGLLERLTFPLEFSVVADNEWVEAAGMRWRGAPCEHAQEARAVRLDDGGVSLFYSGDGRPTPASAALARGCACVVHEAFNFAGETVGHGSVSGGIDFARQAGAGLLALVHVQREERQRHAGEMQALLGSLKPLRIVLPGVGDWLRF